MNPPKSKSPIFKRLVKISRSMIDLPEAKNKHFSFLIRRNNIVSIGYNLSFSTHPLAKKYEYRFANIHSELSAIKNFPFAPSTLPKYTLVNVRIMGNGTVGLSKPCEKCQKLLEDFDIRNIWYSTRSGFKRLE